MTKDELYTYLDNPMTLSGESIEELRRLLRAYPYSAPCAYLFLCKAAMQNDVCFASELGHLAPLLPSRAKLFRQVAPFICMSEGTLPEAVKSESDTQEDSFGVIEAFLSEMQSSGADLPEKISYSTESAATDYFNLSETTTTPHLNLSIQPTKPSQTTSPIPSFTVQPTASQPIPETEEEDALLTETLAKIYIKQGYYEKALRIIKVLSLKFPEKNIYFADQIRFLEKIIRNNKQE